MYNTQTAYCWVYAAIQNPDGRTLAFAPHPANVYSPFDIPRAAFFLESTRSGGSHLNAFAISDPWGADGPELSSVQFNTVNAYTIPPNASQPGANNNIDTGDARIGGQVTYNAGHLHAALTSGNASGASDAIVYKVRPILNTGAARCAAAACPQITSAAIEDESIRSYGSNFAFFPTPVPDFEGNVTTVFNFSGNLGACAGGGAGCYASLAYDSQRVTLGSGFNDNGIYLATGTAFYNQGRWGDYTAVAPVVPGYQVGATPLRPGFAFSGMYAGPGSCFGPGSGCWFTRIGYNQFSTVNQP